MIREVAVHSKRSATLRLGPLTRTTAEAFGSALRRILMRKLPGLAVRGVKMAALHEFSLSPGVVEDGVQIVENLKKLRFRRLDDGRGPRHAKIDVARPATVVGSDLRVPGLEVINPEQLIATVNQGGRLELEIEVAPAVDREIGQNRAAGFVAIDGCRAPIDRVRLQVEETADGTCLLLGVTTDGSVEPLEATVMAADLLAASATSETVRMLCRGVANVSVVSAPSIPAAVPAQTTREMHKMPSAIEVPDLTELCRDSFESFAQCEVAPSRRRNVGLQRLLKDLLATRAAGAFVGYTLAPSGMQPWECVRYGATYGAELRVRLKGRPTRPDAVVVGLLPMMTARGTFVVSGVEKVVMSQLVNVRADRTGRENDLAARRVKLVGEQLEEALAGALAGAVETTGGRAPLLPGFNEAIRRFFGANPLVQRAETTNPLALLTQLRRVIQRDMGKRPGYEPRHLHRSQYGRLCPIDTPEGERIGLNLSMAVLAGVDDDGLLTTPYRRQSDGSIEYLNAAEEADATVSDHCSGEAYLARYGGKTLALHNGEIVRVAAAAADYAPTHWAQPLGPGASLIPFLASDDSNRALMGTNMQKQAVPLLRPQAPLVITGMERRIAADAGAAVLSRSAGIVERVSADEILVRADGRECAYKLERFSASPLGTCQRQRPLVRPGDEVAAGQLLADGPATDRGILALGHNVLIGYLPWDGYNFEDAIVVSQRLVDEDIFTSIKVKEYTVTVRQQDGDRVLLDAEHLPPAANAHLSSSGIVGEGAWVEGGDILVAKSTGDRTAVDQSLRLPAGQAGRVIGVDHFRADRGDPLAAGVSELVRVTVAVRRTLKVGDKLANRHGGKGVVGLILPEDEMPVLPDGRALEMLVSPLGLPSRMNFGQVLETHAGFAAHELGCAIETSGFNGASVEEVGDLLAAAGLPRSGMVRLRDGRNGRLLERESTVGYLYYMKLDHMSKDAVKSASTVPKTGAIDADSWRGYRLGIMETWALQAHGAAHMLREMSTLQTDAAPVTTYGALVRGEDLPRPHPARGVVRLAQQLRGLCLELQLLDADGHQIDMDAEGSMATLDLDEIGKAALTFATPATIDTWEGAADLRDATAVEAFLDAEAGDGIGMIRLACPVQHPWRAMLGAAASVPAIARLPVLPRSLRNGRTLNGLYLAVAAVNDIVWSEGGVCPEFQSAVQEAVDELIGDGLKATGLTQLLYGKRGWVATAMTGWQVAYSARAVIAPGPNLRQDECGLPRVLARSLFEPFVIGALLRAGEAVSEEEARGMIAARETRAERRLEQVAAARWVLLHRAPVLHRWGLQAFRPVLTDEEVLRLHPLTNATFNADFDGDAMELFLPLSTAAQSEAAAMAPSRNQLSSADGSYVHGLSQEMVFGCYYATAPATKGERALEFAGVQEVVAAFDRGDVATHDLARVAGYGADGISTVGRVLFRQLLPKVLEWDEDQVDKRKLESLLQQCWHKLGAVTAADLADAMMSFGFRMATRSGVSLGKDTQSQFSGCEEMLAAAWQRADALEATSAAGEELVDHWLEVQEEMAVRALEEHAAREGGLNSTYMMMASGARGNSAQLRQQIAMRGLFSRQDGTLYPIPCTTTFVRGQSPLEFIAGVEGARRGLTDTTLKSAKAGFLFKRIVRAVQDVLISEEDCGTAAGLEKRPLCGPRGMLRPLAGRIVGRYAAADLILPATDRPLVAAGALIGREQAAAIEASGLESVLVRSPITCTTAEGLCSRCYGVELSRWSPATLYLPVGVIAAQSLGEPLTQLTMRTFALTGHRRHAHFADILSSLPGLEELYEAGKQPGREESELRAVLNERLAKEGCQGAGSYLLDAMLSHYRDLGVPLDDRHLEVVIRQMVRVEDGTVRGVTEVASQGGDFLTAAAAFGGAAALADAAARGRTMPLNGVASSTAMGKLMPARVPATAL